MLAADQQHLGEYFANMRELEANPFEADPTTEAVTGAPVFEESIAYVDTTVAAAHEAGDHTIYVGEVEEAAVQRPEAPALTYFRGEWGEAE
ncbi:MAG: flavin reductase family protein [Halobacteriales archaeon]|nr:flavin reductase family protein [Halobacteriales archaeon]